MKCLIKQLCSNLVEISNYDRQKVRLNSYARRFTFKVSAEYI